MSAKDWIEKRKVGLIQVIRQRMLLQASALFLLLIVGSPVASQTLLTLEAKSQARIAGTFKYKGAAFKFVLTKRKNVDRGGFSLILPNNRQIFDARFGEKGAYSVKYYGGRLSISSSPPVGKPGTKRQATPGTSFKGDKKALQAFVNSREYKALPYLSRELGRRHGITGNAFPVSLPLHMMALSAAKMHPKQSPWVGAAKSKSKCKDLRRDNCSGCFGMCGPKCNCWEWVCGNCCCRRGCKEHDQACRGCRWDRPDPVACTRCAAFDLGHPYFQCKACTISCGSGPYRPPTPNCGTKYCSPTQQCCERRYCIPKRAHCM